MIKAWTDALFSIKVCFPIFITCKWFDPDSNLSFQSQIEQLKICGIFEKRQLYS